MTPDLPTVLVVDDEPDLRAVVATLLEEEGYAVKQAPDGLAALEEVEADGVDLIVTDVRMPRLDGAGLIQRLRQRGVMIPVVVMTATHVTLSLPEVRVVPKPFAPEHLLAAVSAALLNSA